MNDFFENASILITGGTGILGKALVSRLLDGSHNLKRLVIFSRDEQKQYQMALDFPTEKYPCLRYFIGDVRDLHRLRQAMNGIDMVIHAAAMKHIHIAEYNPMECIQTNIMGGQNVITACIEKQVKNVVALSTDKAAAPINLYGATKLASDKLLLPQMPFRRCEYSLLGRSLWQCHGLQRLGRSTLPEEARNRSAPHMDLGMTRFNITTNEAVDMVLYALEEGVGGEIFVPKIPSYRISTSRKRFAPSVSRRSSASALARSSMRR